MQPGQAIPFLMPLTLAAGFSSALLMLTHKAKGQLPPYICSKFIVVHVTDTRRGNRFKVRVSRLFLASNTLSDLLASSGASES